MVNTAQMLLPAAMVGGAPAYGSRGVFIVDRYGATVSSAMTVSGVILSSAGTNNSMYVWSRGVASATAIRRSGFMCVYPRGVANSTTVDSGLMCVSSAGTANGTAVNGSGSMWVYSGGVANSATVSRGFLVVYSGGTAVGLTALSYGNINVEVYAKDAATVISGVNSRGAFSLSGGVASNFVLYSRGVQIIHSGALTSDVTINNSATLSVSSGGSALGVVQESGAAIQAQVRGGDMETVITGSNDNGAFYLSGGTAYNFKLYNFQHISVSSGGVVESTTVSGLMANMTVSSGGTANSTVLSLSSYMSAFNGAVVNETIINNWARVYVYSGAVANNVVVESGGSLYIAGGATVTVSQGSILRNVSADAGAVIDCRIGETAENWSGCTLGTGNTIGSGIWRFNGSSTALTLSNNVLRNFGAEEIEERLIVGRGITVVEPIIRSECRIFAEDDCVISGGTILTSGNITLWDDTKAYDVTVGRPGMLPNAHFNVAGSAGTAYDTVVEYGGRFRINSGGTAIRASVNSSGGVVVLSGAYTESMTLNDHGSMTVSSGGSTTYTTVNYSGRLNIYGNAENTVVNSGGVVHIAHNGSATTTIINNHGSVIVSSTGKMSDGIVNGGRIRLYYGGSADLITVSSGEIDLEPGGRLITATVNSGLIHVDDATAREITVNNQGVVEVTLGGRAMDTIVNVGGYLSVEDGGSATIVYNPWQGSVASAEGAYVEYLDRSDPVYYGDPGIGLLSRGEYISGVTVDSGQSAFVYSGGSADDMTVNAYGSMYVSSGALVKNTLVSGTSAKLYVYSSGYASGGALVAGGNVIINKGGSAGDLMVSSSARLVVSSAGTAIGTIILNGGSTTISAGGSAVGVTMSGGYMYANPGSALDTIIYSTGRLYVYSNAVALRTTVNAGGQLRIYNGGVVESAVINTGGLLYISSGGVLNSAEVTGGGGETKLNIQPGAIINNIGIEEDAYLYVSSGCQVSGVTLYGGGAEAFVLSGGVLNDIHVQNDGCGVTISAAGYANEVYVAGEAAFCRVFGSAEDINVYESASCTILPGGYCEDLTIYSGGTLIVSSAGTAILVYSATGANIIVESGGSCEIIK